ncbi:MAG: carboxypeptidase regulatory-like domain-containing protein [Planctomycetes bacterium]|nr:carboxypeptidase regulatory-like domain-containing protein [Planctomycetota bacterium]
MQRSIAVALLFLILGTVAYFAFRGNDGAQVLPTPVDTAPVVEANNVASEAVDSPKSGQPVPGVVQRTEVAVTSDGLLDDPEIRAGLSGFRGRVVTHDKRPVADCGVRFYRGGMDTVLREGMDLFADEPTVVPDYIAGETRTAEDGTFALTGVWPHGAYIMFAGIGTDAPMHELVTRTPSPGEIIDLGDVVLPDAGVLIGTVVDDDGAPMVGALVRAADVPGTLAGFFPLERFEPDGAVLIREPRAPVSVVAMPAWVKEAFEHVPLPTTVTDGDGRFRLVGVVPGSNMLAVTAKDHLAEVKPSVQVRAGEEKDVGTIRLRAGEELYGKVVDTAGEPVADAEVFAGSTIGLAPVDLARRLQHTDAKGTFTGLGFAPGKVTVAARRGPGHAWVLAEPQPIIRDVVVTLPATFGIDASITLADGKPAVAPRIRLLQGRAGDGAAEMAVFGFVPPVDLSDRLEKVAEEDGRWRITNLNAGEYTLVADAPGHATGFAAVKIESADTSVALQLTAKKNFTVRVVDHETKPIRNAAIYAEASGKKLFDMPARCGRTDAEGTLLIDKFLADELRVSAEHPKWGVVHGEARLGEVLVLQMQPPGSLEGVLTDSGTTPEPGRWTIIVEWRRNGGTRGPFSAVPRMVTPDAEGRFRVASLQPGQYRLQAVDALAAMRSPGGMVQMFMSQRMMGGNRQRETVDVVSGQTAQVRLDSGEKPIEGPTAHLYGRLTIDGRLGEGYRVMAWIEGRRYGATIDRVGGFDLGTVPAGNAWVSVSSSDGLMGLSGSNIWTDSIELKAAEERELVIDVRTSSLAGAIFDPTGGATTGYIVQAQGSVEGRGNNVHLHSPVDATGNFSFEQVPEGTWSLTVVSAGEKSGMRGELEGIKVMAGVPVTGLRVELRPVAVVKGSLDLSMFGSEKPRWAWISIHETGADGKIGTQRAGIGVDMDDGAFETDELGPGVYAVRIHSNTEKGSNAWRCQDITVPPGGLDNLLLRGTPE